LDVDDEYVKEFTNVSNSSGGCVGGVGGGDGGGSDGGFCTQSKLQSPCGSSPCGTVSLLSRGHASLEPQ
jgi:hypothetical protein